MKPRPSNPWWATTSRDELHHRQDALLRRFLKDRVVPFTAHYGKLFKELGIEAGDIRGTDDLKLLPFTSKKDLTTPRDFVIIPDENKKDLADIPANVTDGLKIVPVKWIDEVLDLALERPLAPVPAAGGDGGGRVVPATKKERGKGSQQPGVKH